VFIARYALNHYIKQILLVFKGLNTLSDGSVASKYCYQTLIFLNIDKKAGIMMI
jgi:hypothetical protein